jgi:nucleotide sugar dehydrogenase
MAQAFYRMDIDVMEVINAASTKPFSFMPHKPGIGVGGHCIAVDPYYMIEKGNASGFDHEFLRLARKINENMPTYTVNLLHNLLNKMGLTLSRVRVGVYGLSYKQDVEDDRESPSYVIINKLVNDKNANIEIFDPYHLDKSTKLSINDFLENIDCLLVCTSHNEITTVNFKNFKNIKLVLDGRNCLNRNDIESQDIKYSGIGLKG